MNLKSSLLRRAFLLTLLTAALPAPLPAAVAPLDEKELEAQSVIIVTGEVTAITPAKNAAGTVEIDLKIASVQKGDVKTGTVIRLVSWSNQMKTKPPGHPGPQGLSPLPKKGDTVKAWLNAGKENSAGKTYTPLLPNGVQVVPAARTETK